MADAPPTPHVDPDGDALDMLNVAEFGDETAAMLRRHRRAEETRYRATHPQEGLRERKRRLTRQLISDVATALAVSRGFDEVRVADVAERVGVSEKTVYNYFATREAMVLDGADDLVGEIATALRDRAPDESITAAVVRALRDGISDFDVVSEEMADFIPRFVELIETTPALHAHWLQVHERVARVAIEELAAQAGVDPRDPEPTVAGRALVGLVEVGMEAQMRHVKDGLRGTALIDAVIGDVERAARVIDGGLRGFV